MRIGRIVTCPWIQLFHRPKSLIFCFSETRRNAPFLDVEINRNSFRHSPCLRHSSHHRHPLQLVQDHRTSSTNLQGRLGRSQYHLAQSSYFWKLISGCDYYYFQLYCFSFLSEFPKIESNIFHMDHGIRRCIHTLGLVDYARIMINREDDNPEYHSYL